MVVDMVRLKVLGCVHPTTEPPLVLSCAGKGAGTRVAVGLDVYDGFRADRSRNWPAGPDPQADVRVNRFVAPKPTFV